MKIRVSHFQTKNIEINKVTRPEPKKAKLVLESAQVKKPNRQVLAKKLGLQVVVSRRKVSVRNKTKRVTPKQRQAEAKNRVIQKQLAKESAYASHPKRPRSQLLERIINQEVILFRKHGSRQMDNRKQGFGRNNLENVHQLQEG